MVVAGSVIQYGLLSEKERVLRLRGVALRTAVAVLSVVRNGLRSYYRSGEAKEGEIRLARAPTSVVLVQTGTSGNREPHRDWLLCSIRWCWTRGGRGGLIGRLCLVR